MLKEPKDLIFEKYGNKIQFAAWHMAYDKGANAGIKFTIKTTASDDRVIDPDDLFGHKVTATINIQDLIGGMTYKDLMDLSEWAKNAAKFVKAVEVKYRGKAEFDKMHTVNELRIKK